MICGAPGGLARLPRTLSTAHKVLTRSVGSQTRRALRVLNSYRTHTIRLVVRRVPVHDWTVPYRGISERVFDKSKGFESMKRFVFSTLVAFVSLSFGCSDEAVSDCDVEIKEGSNPSTEVDSVCHTSIGQGQTVRCNTLLDCPPSGQECVVGICPDGYCRYVDLSDPEVLLPVHPESKLPIGKGCRP